MLGCMNPLNEMNRVKVSIEMMHLPTMDLIYEMYSGKMYYVVEGHKLGPLYPKQTFHVESGTF